MLVQHGFGNPDSNQTFVQILPVRRVHVFGKHAIQFPVLETFVHNDFDEPLGIVQVFQAVDLNGFRFVFDDNVPIQFVHHFHPFGLVQIPEKFVQINVVFFLVVVDHFFQPIGFEEQQRLIVGNGHGYVTSEEIF